MNNTWHDISVVGYPNTYGKYLVSDSNGRIKIRTYDPNIDIPFYKPNTDPTFQPKYWMELPDRPGETK